MLFLHEVQIKNKRERYAPWAQAKIKPWASPRWLAPAARLIEKPRVNGKKEPAVSSRSRWDLLCYNAFLFSFLLFYECCLNKTPWTTAVALCIFMWLLDTVLSQRFQFLTARWAALTCVQPKPFSDQTCCIQMAQHGVLMHHEGLSCPNGSTIASSGSAPQTGTSGLDFEHHLSKFFGLCSNETSHGPQSSNLFLFPAVQHWYATAKAALWLCVFITTVICTTNETHLQPHLCSSASQGSVSWSCAQGSPLSCFSSSALGGTGVSPAVTIGHRGGPDDTLSAVLSGSSLQAYLYWIMGQKAFYLSCKKQLKWMQKSHPIKGMCEVHISWLTALMFFMCVCVYTYRYK